MVEEQLKQYKFFFREFSVIGKRPSNEDRTFIIDHKPWQLMLLADGMGGYSNGEVAAEEAVTFISSKFVQLSNGAIDELKSIFSSANQIINETVSGAGTTIGGVFLRPGSVDIFWLGDVRVYIKSKQDQIQFVSKDHSLMQLMRDSNSPIKATEIDRLKNTVTRSLGVNNGGWEPEIVSLGFSEGIKGLICSDGVHNLISDQDLFSILGSEIDQEIFDQIFERIRNKASDNASAIFFSFKGNAV